ncbi:hypothetical protein V6L77_21680 [Pannonibacter sp. Pt2-lr]
MSTLSTPGRGVLDQIALLPRSPRPLIICDVDEVVLHMILHLEEFLAAHGLVFLAYSYRLTGNIAEEASGRVLAADEVHRLVQAFFEDIADRQTIVDGAAPALTRLSEAFEIVFLTNLPGVANKPLREKLLAAHGLTFRSSQTQVPRARQSRRSLPGAASRSCSLMTARRTCNRWRRPCPQHG